MIGAIKFISKVVTVATVAKTGYDLYKKGEVAYSAYKKTKTIKSSAGKTLRKIKRILK